MEQQELIPHLFRSEYQKIVSVLCRLFGIAHVETAEDIVSDTFLAATEAWSTKGIPENPTAWLYTVAKNKTKNYLKRDSVFRQKLSPEILYHSAKTEEFELDLSIKNIGDSQLEMIFTVCNPQLSVESQVALALNLLCGFGVQEIADAYLTNKEVVYKRLKRAKEKLKAVNVRIEQPSLIEISERIDSVLTTLYLLFSEGYYSTTQNTPLRRDFCAEAMRLVYLLVGQELTNVPEANALLSLMCFHVSRFDARTNPNGETILYYDQDESRWNQELIEQGKYYLALSAKGNQLTKYHLEAGIAYWHTHKQDTSEKWQQILQLYNNLLIMEYSPIVALNRTFALSKVYGKSVAIVEAEKLKLNENHFYYSLLGNLYTDIDDTAALKYYRKALHLASSNADKITITKHIQQLGA